VAVVKGGLRTVQSVFNCGFEGAAVPNQPLHWFQSARRVTRDRTGSILALESYVRSRQKVKKRPTEQGDSVGLVERKCFDYTTIPFLFNTFLARLLNITFTLRKYSTSNLRGVLSFSIRSTRSTPIFLIKFIR
jgi:hypothetical protein